MSGNETWPSLKCILLASGFSSSERSVASYDPVAVLSRTASGMADTELQDSKRLLLRPSRNPCFSGSV